MKISKFEQSIFVTNDGKNLVYVEVTDRDGCNAWSMSVIMNNKTVMEKTTYLYTESSVKILLPEVSEPTEAIVCLEPFMERPERFKVMLKPVKKLQIKILSSSHEDLGYCAYANELGVSCRDYILKAIDLAEKRSDYKYVIEHYWMLDAFEKYAEAKDIERLKRCFESGSIGIGAAMCGVHTSWQSKEEIIRSVYYTTCKAKKTWGISSKSVLYTDISGASSSVIGAYSDCGIKYITFLENTGFRSRPYRYNFPKLFKWKEKESGKSLICWHQIGYSLPELDAVWKSVDDFVLDETMAAETEKIVSEYVREFGADYEIIPISFYHDRELPCMYLADICKEMNKRWKYPQFSLGLLDEIFEEIDEKCGDSLSVLSGEVVDQWADFATISSKWLGSKRNAQNVIRDAEAMATIAAVNEGSAYPQNEIETIYWKMNEFDEHCWATSAKNPQKMHLYNIKLMKEQNAEYVNRQTQEILSETIGVADENDEEIRIWNFVPHETKRGAVLKRPIKGIECQKLNENTYLTEPIAVDGFQSKTFLQTDDEGDVEQIFDSVTDTGKYILRCDFETGNIIGITDKETQKELIESFGEYKFGDFVYVHDCNAKLTLKDEIIPDINCDIAKTRKFEVERGKVATVVRKTSYEEQLCANVCMTVIFYRNEKNIDIKLSFKNASSMMGNQLDRYKKNIFFAFPFKMENYKFRTQTPADLILEDSERLKNGPNDFSVAENYVTVEEKDGGVALYSKEAPVFHLGGIHYDKLDCDIERKSSTIFVYAASNRCNQLVYRSVEDCCGEYNLSVLPYKEFDICKINNWADEKNHPLIPGSSDFSCEGIEIDNKAICLTALKKEICGDGIIARFYNQDKMRHEFSVKLPFEISGAEYVSMNEDCVFKAAEKINGKSITADIKPRSYVTLRLRTKSILTPKSGRSDAYVDELFFFTVENDKTMVSFKKNNCEGIKKFEIYSDGECLAVVDNTKPQTQFCEIEKIGLKNVEIRMHE